MLRNTGWNNGGWENPLKVVKVPFVTGTRAGRKKCFSEVYTDSFTWNVTLTSQTVPALTTSNPNAKKNSFTLSFTRKVGNLFPGASVREAQERLRLCRAHVPSHGSPYSTSTHQQLRAAQDLTQLIQGAGSPIFIPQGWTSIHRGYGYGWSVQV